MVIIVIGLHCGGTSAVAGVLHHLGVFMGEELLGPSYNNPKGHFEDMEFVRLHDQMIGDWRNPKPPSHWSKCYNEYKELIERRCSAHDLWGVKDPRLVWVAKSFIYLYSSHTHETVKVINVERRPGLAAQSLYNRGGHTPLEALEISYRYYAEKSSLLGWGYSPDTRHPRAIYHTLSYTDLIERPRRNVEYLAEIIGRPYWDYEIPKSAYDFIDPSLCHWREAC